MIKIIAIADLRLDLSPQPRGEINKDVAEEYAEVIDSGKELHPVDVFNCPEGLIVPDGRHRIEAHILRSKTHIKCNLKNGTLDEARMAALASNHAHGYRRTNAQKRSYAFKALTWFSDWANNRIAEHAGITDKTVQSIREESFPETLNAPRIDKRGTVRKLPASKPPPPPEDTDPEPVSGLAHGSTFSAGPYGNSPAQSRNGPRTNSAPKPAQPLNPVAGAIPKESDAWSRVSALVEPGLHAGLRKNPKLVAAIDKNPEHLEAARLVLVQHWTLADSISFLKREITNKSKVQDLIVRCLAAGGSFETTVDTFRITIERQ